MQRTKMRGIETKNGNNGANGTNGTDDRHSTLSSRARRYESRSQVAPMPDEEKFGMEGLTFDDVLLVPAYSEVLPTPEYISTATFFTPTISLNIPIISAAM